MKIIVAIGLLTALLLWYVQQPFTFISLESKTVTNGDVYNRIKFIPGVYSDIWLMQQSHQGINLSSDTWDRLAIVVDKTKTKPVATFFQFVGGALVMGTAKENAPFRAPCFSCHASGPRAIRAKTSHWLDDIKIALLNMRIKMYGAVDGKSSQEHDDGYPFRRKHVALKKSLQRESCVRCHHSDGLRNELLRDHFSTAQFLVKNGEMPPWPFSLSEDDRNYFLSD